MKVRIQIDTETFVRFWLVVIGFIFAILMIYLARTALIIIGMSAFLAVALSVPVKALAARIPGKSRVGATAIAFTGLIVAIGIFITLVIPPIVQQTGKLIDSAPAMIDTASNQWEGVGTFVEQYNIKPQFDQAVQSMRDSTERWIQASSRSVVTGIGSFVSALAAVFLALVLTFLMLIEGPQWMNRLWKMYRDEEKMRRHKNLVSRIHNVITGYVVGQLSVAGIGALVSGLVVFLLSLFTEVPSNLAVPSIAIAFIFALIPMFGSTIAGVLIALLLAFNSLAAAIIFAVVYIIYQQIENNLISPAIQSRYLKLSPLTVLVAVTIGLYLFGLIGGIISIPIAGTIKVLLEDYHEHSEKRRKAGKRPLAKLTKKIHGEA